MAWLLIISSVIVIWIASLLKILHGSYSPSKGAFLNDSNNGGRSARAFYFKGCFLIIGLVK